MAAKTANPIRAINLIDHWQSWLWHYRTNLLKKFRHNEDRLLFCLDVKHVRLLNDLAQGSWFLHGHI